MSESPVASISLKVEFSGGLELLFSNQRSHKLSVPALVPTIYGDTTSDAQKPADITFLIHYLRDNLLKERVELFMENGTVRPGILVLVNDTDWELEGEGEYALATETRSYSSPRCMVDELQLLYS